MMQFSNLTDRQGYYFLSMSGWVFEMPLYSVYFVKHQQHAVIIQKRFELQFFILLSTQKKNQRIKALNLSTALAPQQKEEYMEFMTTEYMSSEHSMSESEEEEEGDQNGSASDAERPHVKVFSVSTLPWRSEDLTKVMHSLDRKVMRRRSAKGTSMTVRRRKSGVRSSRPAPEDAPDFALS